MTAAVLPCAFSTDAIIGDMASARKADNSSGGSFPASPDASLAQLARSNGPVVCRRCSGRILEMLARQRARLILRNVGDHTMQFRAVTGNGLSLT